MGETRSYRDFIPNRYRSSPAAPRSVPQPGDVILGNAVRPTVRIGTDGKPEAHRR